MRQRGARDSAELAEAALSDSEALVLLSHELRTLLAAFRGGAVLPAPVRQELLAEHRALQAELEALHLQDLAGLVDAAGHERFRELVRGLTERLQVIRQGTGG